MFLLILKKTVKNYENIRDNEVRSGYGRASGLTGVLLNLILFSVKYFAGIISGSIAVTADALNNLSDMGSSIVTLIGFRLAAEKPDADHPYGHGRAEYLAALAVSVIILFMGLETGKSSVNKIIARGASEVTPIVIGILLFSILIKFYMFSYNRKYGELIGSSVLKATAADSLWDAVSTTIVLVSMLIMKMVSVNIDGWCGLVVSLFIIKAGISTARDTIGDILGSPPEKELISEIEKTVMAHDEILGVHDIVVHDYGPGRLMISLHGEVDGNGDIFELHEAIDRIEKELASDLGCEAVIHMDPVAIDDKDTETLKSTVSAILTELDARITMHDMHVYEENGRKVLDFDVVVPFDFETDDEKLKEMIIEEIKNNCGSYKCNISVDRPYI